MTPYELAKDKEKQPKPCGKCEKSERINEVLYCTVSGKIILPRFENLSICNGKR